MGSLLAIALHSEISEKSELSPDASDTPRLTSLDSLNSLNSHSHEDKNTSRRWRITPMDGEPFEVDIWPEADRAEVQASYPGADVEAIPEPQGGTLSPDEKTLILTVMKAWGATPEETVDVLTVCGADPKSRSAFLVEAEALGAAMDADKEWRRLALGRRNLSSTSQR